MAPRLPALILYPPPATGQGTLPCLFPPAQERLFRRSQSCLRRSLRWQERRPANADGQGGVPARLALRWWQSLWLDFCCYVSSVIELRRRLAPPLRALTSPRCASRRLL